MSQLITFILKSLLRVRGKATLLGVNGLPKEDAWFVAHTRPRCEKKLQRWCDRESFTSCLPTYISVRKYASKEVRFSKPLFPGYLFLSFSRENIRVVKQSQYIANLLEPPNQGEFETQLGEIMKASTLADEMYVAPSIGPGTRVVIRRGPLAGIEAWVEDRSGIETVILRLDFIGQGAIVNVPAHDLELA